MLVTIVTFFSVGFLLRFLRWHWYLKRLHLSVPLLPSLRIFIAAFEMTLTPGKLGETAKAFLLYRGIDVSPTPVISGVFCERITDVAARVLLPTTCGFLIYPYGRQWMVLSVIVLLGLIILLSWILSGRRITQMKAT